MRRWRKRYADDPESLQRVETACLRLIERIAKEEAESERARPAAEVHVAGLRRFVVKPTLSEFRRATLFFGALTLLGRLSPGQAATCVGLAIAGALGSLYQRGRPELVRDSAGNLGEVRPLDAREVVATTALVSASLGLGAALTAVVVALAETSALQETFCALACGMLWLTTLIFEVVGRFGPNHRT